MSFFQFKAFNRFLKIILRTPRRSFSVCNCSADLVSYHMALPNQGITEVDALGLPPQTPSPLHKTRPREKKRNKIKES